MKDSAASANSVLLEAFRDFARPILKYSADLATFCFFSRFLALSVEVAESFLDSPAVVDLEDMKMAGKGRACGGCCFQVDELLMKELTQCCNFVNRTVYVYVFDIKGCVLIAK